MDAALRKTGVMNIFEGHPEVNFALMNEGLPLLIGKKKSAGRAYRAELISRRFPDANTRIAQYRHHREDVRDAYALLWTAQRINLGEARIFPSDLNVDRLGLRMEIAG